MRWPGAILAALPPRGGKGVVASYGPSPGLDGLGIGMDSMGGGGEPPTTLATAFAVIKLLSGTCASLPRRVHERSDLNRTQRRDPEFEHLWGRPNPSRATNAIAWWEMLFASLEGWANSYSWISRVPGTQGWRGVDGLYFLSPGIVMPGEDANREKRFAIGQDRERSYGPDEVLHIMGLSFDGIRGISPVRAGPGAHDLALQAERFGRVFFRNGTRLSGVVMTEAAYNKDTAKEFLKDWSQMHSGVGNVGSVALFQGPGAKFEKIGIPPDEAQFLETRQFQREEVLSIWAPGLPHHMLGWKSNTSNFGTGIEQQGIHLVTYVLNNRLRRVEDAIDNELLPPGLEFRFNVNALLRGDAATRVEVLNKMRMAGVLSAGEWRELEDMGPREIDDDYLFPLNMTRIDAATGEQIAGQPASAMQPPRTAPVEGQKPPGLLAEMRCQNAQCKSRRNGRGALLARSIGDGEVVCTQCHTATRVAAGEVIRDPSDYGDLLAEEVAKRLS